MVHHGSIQKQKYVHSQGINQSIHLTGTVHLTGTLWVCRKDVLTSQRIFTQIQQINSQKISPPSTDFRTIDKNELNFL